MKKSNKKKSNKSKLVHINKYRNRLEMNLGVVIFGIVFIYLLASVVMYLLTPNIKIYEVRKGSILKDSAFNGLILRDESVILSDSSGYIHYYPQDESRVTVGSNLYTILDTENINTESTETDQEVKLGNAEKREIQLQLQAFNSAYSESNYDAIYSLKSDLNSIMDELDNTDQKLMLDTYIQNSNQNYEVVNSDMAGIFSYTTDGYEMLQLNQVDKDSFDKDNYEVTNLESGAKTNGNAPIGKIVQSEEWSIVINLSEEQSKEYSELEYVDVKFLKDDKLMTAGFSIEKKGAEYFGILSFDSGVIRYAEDRFLDIELIIENLEGYKVPITSVIQKELLEVPIELFQPDTAGLLQEQKNGEHQLITPEIFLQTDEFAYIDPAVLEGNMKVYSSKLQKNVVLIEKKMMDGIYNINKGYAEFKCVEILTSSEEYYIISSNTTWDISNYDHIALDGAVVEEGDIVF